MPYVVRAFPSGPAADSPADIALACRDDCRAQDLGRVAAPLPGILESAVCASPRYGLAPPLRNRGDHMHAELSASGYLLMSGLGSMKGIERSPVDAVAGVLGELLQERALGTAVAFAEWMGGVDLGQVVGQGPLVGVERKRVVSLRPS